MKTWKKILRLLVLVALLVPTAALVAIQIPAVQTAAVRKACDLIGHSLDGSAQVGKVYFSFPNNLILKDIDIIQGSSDTVLHASKLLVKVKTSSLVFSDKARIRRISLEDGHASIRRLDDSTTTLSLLLAPFLKEKKDDSGTSLPWSNIRLDRLNVKNFDFSLNNRLPSEDNDGPDSGHADWKNLIINKINLSARNLEYDGNLNVIIDNLSFSEAHGLELERLGGLVRLDGEGLSVSGMEYKDGWSELHSDHFSLGFKQFSDLSDFFGKVSVDAGINNTLFDLQTLYFFTGEEALKDKNTAVWVDGEVSGPLNRLRSDLIRVQSLSRESSITMKARVNGLPRLSSSNIELQIFDGRTNSSDLGTILSNTGINIDPKSIRNLANGETVCFSGNLSGPMQDLVANMEITTESMGSVSLDGAIRNLTAKTALQIEGQAKAKQLELGSLFGIPALGNLSADAEIALSSGKGNSEISFSPIRIGNFSFNGYDYHDIVASGRLNGRNISADIHSSDPNLQLMLHGDIELGGKGSEKRYRISMDLDTMNLSALNFDSRDGVTAGMALSADLVQTPEGDILGEAGISSLKAKIQDEVFDIGDLFFNSTLDDGEYALTLNSSIVKADYSGNMFIADYLKQAVYLAGNGCLNHIIGKGQNHEFRPEGHGSVTLSTLDMSPLCSFFAPGLFVSRESSVSMSMLGEHLEGSIGSELFAVGGLIVHNTRCRIFTDDELLRLDTDIDRMETGALAIDRIAVDAAADSSAVDICAKFSNNNGSDNRAEINSRISFAGSNTEQDGRTVKAEMLRSNLTVAERDWTIEPSVISYRKGAVDFDDFRIMHGRQSLRIDGTAGENAGDTVCVRLEDFDVSIVNAFLQKNFDIQGKLTGVGEGIALFGKQKGLLLDLDGRDFSMAGQAIGDIDIQSHWNDSDKKFHIMVDNSLEGRQPLRAVASYRPYDKETSAVLDFDRLALNFTELFLGNLVSGLEGSVSGHLTASGPIGRLSMKSEGTRLDDIRFKLLYTNVDYSASGPFTVGNDGIRFNNITVLDKYSHAANLSGSLDYEHFRNIKMNARLDLQDVLALNTRAGDNENFYGRAFADGTVRISGPFDAIRLNLNLTTKGNSSVHIPLGNSAKDNKSLLTFINNEEKKLGLYDSLVLARQLGREKKGSGQKSGLGVNLRLNATPDAEVQIEIDRNTGDILKARGNGNIRITVDGNNSFDIKGDYRVESGNYHFGMIGITSRDFSIDPGGTIAFVGDVMQSKLDVTATYRTKASISPLIADSTAVNTRRTVECGIAITGRLANPDIGFNISVPDLDPTTQSRVESALNTEDKRMKQALALLISGGFVPDEQSGIVNSTTMLYSNASELMAGQINNIFRQLDIPLDLGFNYQPTGTGRDIFDVAVSTQLFNNRVNINGNIGNRQYMSSSNSDIVGDIDIEIKLNRTGQVRLTLFSHSADQYSNYLDQSQRNGAGIVYQEDFNTLRELWRKILHIKDDERKTLPDSDPVRRPQP